MKKSTLPMISTDRQVLLADIGGTHTRIALARAGQIEAQTIQRYRNDTAASFDQHLLGFLAANAPVNLAACCIAVAAPVRSAVAQMTNLDWILDSDKLQQITGADQVILLNDLEALGYGLETLQDSDHMPLFGPRPDVGNRESQLIIGVGTGFNAAVVNRHKLGQTWIGRAECGHKTLPVRDAEMLALTTVAGQSGTHCSIEDVLSGRGFEAVYNWTCTRKGETPKSTAEIWETLSDTQDATVQSAAHYFLKVLGGVIGDLALTHLPYGGIYLAGGVIRRLAPFIPASGLQTAMQDKGPKTELMPGFCVLLIKNDYVALHGCLNYLKHTDDLLR